MRSFLRFLIPLALVAAPAFAQEELEPQEEEQPAIETAPELPAPEGPKSESRLDTLFSELKKTRNEAAAQRIAGQIWAEWMKSGSATVDLLMQWSNDATKTEKWGVALDFLDQVVTLQPDYAEGWNRRATVHFLMRNYASSMADIERTLRLEPRHFGALSGLGAIMKTTGRKELALDAYERALAVYPMMRSAQKEVGEIADELTGEGI